jgi:site-specific DNA-methyltransferase (adenine-specific)
VTPYWTSADGRLVIYHGDCRDVLPSLGRRVDAIVTDPPYAVPTVVAQGRTVTRNIGDMSIVEAGLGLLLKAATDRLSPAGRVFVFCDGTSYSSVFRALYGDFSTALLIWDKGQFGMGREFRKSHELILHGWRETTPVYSDGVGRPDVLRCPPVLPEKRIHPAEKPIALLSQLMPVCGSLILDPFMGSGSTLRAALNSNRAAIGIEISEAYCEAAAKRLEDPPLLAAVREQQSALFVEAT